MKKFIFVALMFGSIPCFAKPFSIDIPDAQVERVLKDVCNKYGYQEKIFSNGEMIPNPQTCPEFFQVVLINFIGESAAAFESQKAGQDSAKQAKETFDKEVIITTAEVKAEATPTPTPQ